MPEARPVTAYAVILSTDAGTTLASLATTPECAVRGVSPLEGANVLGLATIALEPEPITGMRFVLREVGPSAAPVALPRASAAEGEQEDDASAHLRAAHAAGCRIQVWRLVKDAASSGDGHWVTLTAPEFACPAHLYRVHPEDVQRTPSAQAGEARPDGGNELAEQARLMAEALEEISVELDCNNDRDSILATIDSIKDMLRSRKATTHPTPAPDVARLVVDQLRQELAADKGWDYTQYEKGRIAEKERCIALLTAAQQGATNGQE